MAQVASRSGALEVRLEDSEARSQWNNIHLLGIREQAEGPSVAVFVECWIKDVLQPLVLSGMLLVEHAQRALVVPPRPGAPPRAIIVRILNYRDRDCVLRTARETDKVRFENHKISIYPEYTNKVQTSRKGFMEVQAKLRAMSVCYKLLCPSCLKVISGGRSHFFACPEEVWRWLEMWYKAHLSGLNWADSAAGTMGGSGGSN
ncbi:hypothetical protein NDU88_004457 [Pleurodeles waltl]|uniref:Uncharacterized protein n=1 Tax=Pleurodeles waltl TaxID=8319 RepID=A0AAV7W949_PLEWA|nr:hypothetical protein NDU88_004457 [Pleurodeles waltl]